MLELVLLAATLTADFPGGSAGKAVWQRPEQVRVAVEGQSDQDGRNRQANWYYFRLDGVKGLDLRVVLTDLVGEYNYQPGTHAVRAATRPVFSYDNQSWTHFGDAAWDEDALELTVGLRAQHDTLWIAHTPPYTTLHLERLSADIAGHPHLRREAVGKTVHGRPMPLWTISDPQGAPDRPVVWWMFRQHAWETGTSWAGEGAVRFLLGDSAEAAALRRAVTWKVFPLADPDGAAEGGVRFNRNGYDLNRNWDSLDAELMPEIFAQHQAVAQWLKGGGRIDAFFTIHNTESGEYLEGPAEHRAFVAQLRQSIASVSNFAETRPEPRDAAGSTTPGQKGRMSVNQGLNADFGIAAMLMETRVEAHPGLGGQPRGIDDWKALGVGLVRGAARVVAPQQGR